ncbi:aminotransferase-like domain-containing protein [Lacticaseibacillus daqingensis]|uniref:aminotransferase-like domain-containing protein n=1 Tax=Lacticaseibacillus daqingensis TaxID=2486014 RepID=UPI000F7947D3|nr:PLP-dependent aminotransferase family protein [Lacticaseibacillus daqingensis]
MKFAQRMTAYADNGMDALFAANDPELIAFAGGYPDATLFPAALLGQALTASTTPAALQYSTPQGSPALRTQLAHRLTQDGLPTTADQVLLTQGAQQALDLVARLLIDPGDGLVVEGPTYIGALSAFDTYQPTYYEVPVAHDGMDLTALRQVLRQHPVKLIYTVPDFQNPTGTVMSLAKRRALVALATQYDCVILEDAPYRALRYRGVQLPTLASLDTTGHVIHVSSFSKILAPNLRLGWLTAAPALLTPLIALKGGADLESSRVVTDAVAAYLAHHDLDAHIATLRQVYAAKMARLQSGLTPRLPAGATLSAPDGGFFLWLTCPGLDMARFVKEVLGPQYHVAIVPGNTLSPHGHFQDAARLSFTGNTLAQIDEGARRLGQALQQQVATAAHNAYNHG